MPKWLEWWWLGEGLEGRIMFHFEAKANFLLNSYNFD